MRIQTQNPFVGGLGQYCHDNTVSRVPTASCGCQGVVENGARPGFIHHSPSSGFVSEHSSRPGMGHPKSTFACPRVCAEVDWNFLVVIAFADNARNAHFIDRQTTSNPVSECTRPGNKVKVSPRGPTIPALGTMVVERGEVWPTDGTHRPPVPHITVSSFLVVL